METFTLHTTYRIAMKQISITAIVYLTFLASGMMAQSPINDINTLKGRANAGDPTSLYQLGKVYENGEMGQKQNIKKALDYYEKASLQQYDSALYALGRIYSKGTGVDKNEAIALTYYKTASQGGHAEASYQAGIAYEQGVGITPSLKDAIKYYLIAFEQGYTNAFDKLQKMPVEQYADKNSSAYVKYQEKLTEKETTAGSGNPEKDYELARKYETGQGASRNMKKAYELYKSSADAGYSKAQLSLGLMYAKGVYVPQNNRLAVKYLLAAANQGELSAEAELRKFNVRKFSDTNSKDYLVYQADNGDAESQYRLYLNYLSGAQGFPQDFDKAMEYCQKAALQDHEAAIMTLGNMYEKGGYRIAANPEIAFLWFRKAAYLGNDSARFVLGEMYASGKGVPKDETRAVRWYLQSANSGFGLAQYRLSNYDVKKYVNENDLEYVKYKAAKGDTGEQLKLGKYYYKLNDVQAVTWLTEAGKNGELEAQKLLADIYLHGKCNVPVNYTASFQWYSKAADRYDLEAIRQLAYLHSKNLSGEPGNYLEKAFQRANQYLRLAKKDTTITIDIKIYRILGEIYAKANDHQNAIIHFTDYIQNYEEELDEPLNLVETVEQRAKSYFELEKFESCELDAEVALIHLENFKEHPSIKPNYKYIGGLLLYLQGKAVLKIGNTLKACQLFQKARVSGVVIDSEYYQFCMNER